MFLSFNVPPSLFFSFILFIYFLLLLFFFYKHYVHFVCVSVCLLTNTLSILFVLLSLVKSIEPCWVRKYLMSTHFIIILVINEVLQALIKGCETKVRHFVLPLPNGLLTSSSKAFACVRQATWTDVLRRWALSLLACGWEAGWTDGRKHSLGGEVLARPFVAGGSECGGVEGKQRQAG